MFFIFEVAFVLAEECIEARDFRHSGEASEPSDEGIQAADGSPVVNFTEPSHPAATTGSKPSSTLPWISGIPPIGVTSFLSRERAPEEDPGPALMVDIVC